MQEKNNLYILGRKPLLDLLKASPSSINKVYLKNNIKLDMETKLLLDSEVSSEIIHNVDSEQLVQIAKKFSKEENLNIQGVITCVEKKQNLSFKELTQKSLLSNKFLIALDQIQDPHNLGAILRIAESLGVDGLIKTKKNCVDENLPSVTKISAGASYFMPVVTVSNLANSLLKLKKEGFWIIGSSLEDRSIELSKLDANRPVVLVLGSDGKGLRKQTSQICDYLVKIPMQGKVQSLNVSSATSILVYEINRIVS